MRTKHSKEREMLVDKLTPPDRLVIFWQLLLFVVVSTLAVWLGASYDSELQKYLPESRTLASIFNSKPSGVSGLYEIAKRVGLDCQLWSLPYRQLPEVEGMLVIIQPTESLAEFEVEQILRWVAKGNDLVYLDHLTFKMTRRLVEKLGATAADGAELNEAPIDVEGNKRPEFAHVRRLQLSTDTRLKGGSPLLSDKSGTLIALFKHGRGRVYLGTTPSLCTNLKLTDKNDWPNFQFLVNVFRTAHGAIFFDERCHGFAQATNVFIFLARRTPGIICLQLMIILLAALVSSEQRFGRREKLRPSRSISNLEYINGLARTYLRAKANSTVLEILSQSFRTKILNAFDISPHESQEKVISQLLTIQGQHGERKFLQDVSDLFTKTDQALTTNTISDVQLRHFIHSYDKIVAQLNSSNLSLPLKAPLAKEGKTPKHARSNY